ncbi:MAG: (R)-specific enoyl-CoA hydratase [Promethearchaeota archaeon]|nr:MAG: (R)-specific enoyl-CoA hydratase [Candidatus Lokiarchaeota archaeon]
MSKSNLEPVKFDDYEIGDSAKFTKTITEEDVMKFAEVSGDYNPLHIDPEFAKTQMFGEQVAHGVISVGLISAVLGMELFGPGILYGEQSVRFVKPVYFGDELTAVATVKEKYTKKDGKLKFIRCTTQVLNQEEELVTDGEAVVMVMN